MKLFDTHAHIGLLQDDKMEQLLAVQRAKVRGVQYVVSITNSLGDFERTYANLESASSVLHAVGVSPTEAANPGRDWDERVIAHARASGGSSPSERPASITTICSVATRGCRSS